MMSLKPTMQDFAEIRTSLLIFVLLVVAGAATVAVSFYLDRQMRNTHRQAAIQRSEIQAKLSRAQEEEKEIRIKLNRYGELVSRGYIGNENRLDWIDRIRAIKTARQLLDIEYELAPQQRLSESAAGDYELMTSNMRLRMQLLHEEDLTGFLSDLRTTVTAYLRVNGCSVERLPPMDHEHAAAARLKADCTIDWITLRGKR
jgi:hypothetical protein